MATTDNKFFTSLEKPKFKKAKEKSDRFENLQIQDISKGDVIRIKKEYYSKKLGEKKYVRYYVAKKRKDCFDVYEYSANGKKFVNSYPYGQRLTYGAYYWVEKKA